MREGRGADDGVSIECVHEVVIMVVMRCMNEDVRRPSGDMPR